ncbi:MAG TPA: hypothetical protein VLT51_09805 [Anaerolineales bacterium]|nr:hypothetical protein [Anaerolineales bacterium]
MKANSQTKFLSENYSALHGLNAVPLGLCLFLTSLWANVVQYPIKNFLFPIVLILGTLLLSLMIDQYYKNTFGEIRPTLARRRSYWIAQSICGLLGLVAFWVDITLNLPISFIGLLFVSLLLLDKPMISVPLNRFSAVRLVESICLIFVSITPVFFGKNWWNILGVRATIIGVTMFVGALMVLQGVMWHVFFVKSLPLEEAKDE